MNLNSDYPVKARKTARNSDPLETLLTVGNDNVQDERQFFAHLRNVTAIPFRLEEGGIGLIHTEQAGPESGRFALGPLQTPFGHPGKQSRRLQAHEFRGAVGSAD